MGGYIDDCVKDKNKYTKWMYLRCEKWLKAETEPITKREACIRFHSKMAVPVVHF